MVPIASDDFDRALDATIIKIGAGQSCRGRPCAKPSKTSSRSSGSGKRPPGWRAQRSASCKCCLGAPGVAEQRARKFMQMQRLPIGWRKLVAADENEEEQQL